MKIAIIGAGWYGCHIANYLKNLGLHVTVFERNAQIFEEASGKNQNRLHLGFHYARDYETRLQSRDGYNRFIERYATLTEPVPQNIYAIPRQHSLLDIRTYKLIMASSGIEFEELPLDHMPFDVTNIVGAINTKERLIKVEAARSLFMGLLAENIQFDQTLSHDDIVFDDASVRIQDERFDYVIDATWSKLFPLNSDIFYEPTLLLYYRSDLRDVALTLVDGPLASIYPADEPGRFTLSSVRHTPLGHFRNGADAEARIRQIPHDEIELIREAMEEEILTYLPSFRDSFTYDGPQLSIKTKPSGSEDNRACYVQKQGRLFQVMSGKIDTVFVAAERIISAISYEM